jgi:hypothetical protein
MREEAANLYKLHTKAKTTAGKNRFFALRDLTILSFFGKVKAIES